MRIRNARQWWGFWGTVLFSVGLLTACSSDSASNAAPKDFSEGDACVLDGMYLADFPGPKGQLRYADGRVDWFCDTVELLPYLAGAGVGGIDHGCIRSGHGEGRLRRPRGHWIDARSAFYVFGSSRLGSMGPTAVRFAPPRRCGGICPQHTVGR